MSRLRRLAIWFFISALLLLCVLFLRNDDPSERVLRDLGLTMIKSYTAAIRDSHSGFHQDGVLFIRYEILENGDPSALLQEDGWSPFPLNRAAACLLYGGSIEGHYYGSYIDDIPLVKNGFWYFLDRQNPKTVYTEADIRAVYHRHSTNFRIAVWDTDQGVLYYAAYDS